MSRKYRVGLSKAEMEELKKEFEKKKKKLDNIDREIVTAMLDEGEKIVKETLRSYNFPYGTGELENSPTTEIEKNGKRGYIFIPEDVKQGVFVEYGTGIKGSNSPHPTPPEGWIYDVNEHGEEGWWYRGDDGELHWTQGMPSRPFMYDSAKELRKRAKDIVKGVISDD